MDKKTTEDWNREYFEQQEKLKNDINLLGEFQVAINEMDSELERQKLMYHSQYADIFYDTIIQCDLSKKTCKDIVKHYEKLGYICNCASTEMINKKEPNNPDARYNRTYINLSYKYNKRNKYI